MMGNSEVKAKNTSMLEESLSRLGREEEEYSNIEERLYEKLDMVLMDEELKKTSAYTEDSDYENGERPSTKLVQTIEDISDRLNARNKNMRRLIDRIDL